MHYNTITNTRVHASDETVSLPFLKTPIPIRSQMAIARAKLWLRPGGDVVDVDVDVDAM